MDEAEIKMTLRVEDVADGMGVSEETLRKLLDLTSADKTMTLAEVHQLEEDCSLEKDSVVNAALAIANKSPVLAPMVERQIGNCFVRVKEGIEFLTFERAYVNPNMVEAFKPTMKDISTPGEVVKFTQVQGKPQRVRVRKGHGIRFCKGSLLPCRRVDGYDDLWNYEGRYPSCRQQHAKWTSIDRVPGVEVGA